jgi:hypothetical protein
VKEGLQHVKKQRAMCLSAAEDMRDLVAENHRLIAELNELRFLAGERNTIAPLEPKPLSEAMIELMNVPNEVCGTFPAGFGDNWACESRSQDVRFSQGNDAVLDVAAYCSPTNDIPLAVAVEPLIQDPILDDHEIAASSIPLAQYSLSSAETLSQSSLNGSISPNTPVEVDLLQTLNHEGFIPDMAQLECFAPFDIHQYPPVSLDTMPIDMSTAWWMQGTGMSESVEFTLGGNIGTVAGA